MRSCFFLLVLIVFIAALVFLAFAALYPDDDTHSLFTLKNALLEHGLPLNLLRAFLFCFIGALCAVFLGIPIGLGIAGMGRGRQAALLVFAILALLPLNLTSSWEAIGLDIPETLSLFFAAVSLVALVAVGATKKIPRSMYASAKLSGAPKHIRIARILLPSIFPFIAASLLGSFVFLLLLEGTIFSAARLLFDQGLMTAVFSLLLLVLPLFAFLLYLFAYLRYSSFGEE
jgi:ABC-type sugar transport system permease subunit